jgi:hypothetical protein
VRGHPVSSSNASFPSLPLSRLQDMRVIIRDDYEKACEWVALYLKKRISDFKPTAAKPFVLGLPTGTHFPLLLFVTRAGADRMSGWVQAQPRSASTSVWCRCTKLVSQACVVVIVVVNIEAECVFAARYQVRSASSMW